MIALQKKYGDKGLQVIGVSVDEQRLDAVKQFAQGLRMTDRVLLADAKVIAQFGNFEAIPTTFVIDRAGRVVSQHMGYEREETSAKEIQSLL